MKPDRYAPSGNPGNGYWAILLIAAPITLISSFIYGFVAVYMILPYVSAMMLLFLGLGLGWLTKELLEWGNCRSRRLIVGAGLGIGLLALYTSWASFLYTLYYYSRKSNFEFGTLSMLFLSPGTVCQGMLEVNSTGWFTFSGVRPTGMALGVFWLLEASVLVHCCLWIAMRARNTVFCEACRKWCTRKENLARFIPTQDSELLKSIKAGDLSALLSLDRSGPKDLEYYRVDSQRCEGCRGVTTFEIMSRTNVTDQFGNSNERLVPLSAVFVTTREKLDEFQAAWATKKEGLEVVDVDVEEGEEV